MTDLQKSLSRCKVEGNVLHLPPISDGILANYAEVKKALQNAGATYKKNTFVFPNAAQPYIDKLMGGEKVNIRKEYQFYATPQALADKLVDMANLKRGNEILEPSAGQGAIIKAIHRVMPSAHVHWCELMDLNQEVVRKLPSKTLFMGDDFLRIDAKNKFDRIIANPPFAKNADIDHIYKMYECLADGGRIVTVASKHWKDSSNKKETKFREWLKEVGAIYEEIEAGAFKESGTNISACILLIDKE